MAMKICTSCRAEKPVAEFHRFGPNGERVGKWCEECYKKNKRAPSKPAAVPLQT